MKRQSIHQQIDLLLNALAEQHEQFRERKDTIPQMELDLLLQNTRQLYEAILMLYHNNALSSLDEVKTAVMQRILAEKKPIERKTDESKTDAQLVVEPVSKETKIETNNPARMEELMVKTSNTQTVEEKKEKTGKFRKLSGGVNATLFQDTPSFADSFEDEVTLHEHIASKTSGTTIGDRMHRKPVPDLKAAIGINEKFLFINQLFDGNLQDYSEAIEKLNTSADLNTARQLISAELANRFNWITDNEHVRNFMDLVERRFIR